MTQLKWLKIAFSLVFVFGTAAVYATLPTDDAIETATTQQETTIQPQSAQAVVDTYYPYEVERIVVETPAANTVVTEATPTPTTQVITAGISDEMAEKLELALNQELDDTIYTTVEEYFGADTSTSTLPEAPTVVVPTETATPTPEETAGTDTETDADGSGETATPTATASTSTSGGPLMTVTDASLTGYSQISTYNSFSSEYKTFTYAVAQAYGISYELLIAIMYNESRFNVNATNVNTNGTTDRGLMQINEVCFSTLNQAIGLPSLDSLYDPGWNITSGAYLIYYYMVRYNYSELDALLCYQCGYSGAQKYFTSGERPVTYTYVTNTLSIYQSANLT